MNGASASAGQQGEAQDDDEPVLKYQRMGADVGKLLSQGGQGGGGEDSQEKETVVRMAVHDSHLVRKLVWCSHVLINCRPVVNNLTATSASLCYHLPRVYEHDTTIGYEPR